LFRVYSQYSFLEEGVKTLKLYGFFYGVSNNTGINPEDVYFVKKPSSVVKCYINEDLTLKAFFYE
jgi:hypothetical protein